MEKIVIVSVLSTDVLVKEKKPINIHELEELDPYLNDGWTVKHVATTQSNNPSVLFAIVVSLHRAS